MFTFYTLSKPCVGPIRPLSNISRCLFLGYEQDVKLTILFNPGGREVKLSLQEAVEAYRVVRRRGCHIFYTVGSQTAVSLSALRAGRPLPPGRFLVLISVRGRVDPRAIMQLEILVNWKIQWPDRESNLRPSGLWRSASTNCDTSIKVKIATLWRDAQSSTEMTLLFTQLGLDKFCKQPEVWNTTCCKLKYMRLFFSYRSHKVHTLHNTAHNSIHSLHVNLNVCSNSCLAVSIISPVVCIFIYFFKMCMKRTHIR
jgi:hypothetical protein